MKIIENNFSERIRVGEYNTEEEEDCIIESNLQKCSDAPLDIEVEEIIAHSDFKPDSRDNLNDIALIRLSNDVKNSRFVQPICLPRGALISGLTEGANLTVAGWGQTDLCLYTLVKYHSS